MITNKQYKDHLRSIIVLFEGLYKPGHNDRDRQEVIYRLTEQVNAIPDTDEIDDFQKRTEEIRQTQYKPARTDKIVGPGPRTEQQNRKLEKELRNEVELVMSATSDETQRYIKYVEYMNGLHNITITFAEWLQQDRADKTNDL